MPTIALVHCATMPEPDPDDQILLDAVNAQPSCTSQWCAWDDPSIDWSTFDLCVIRATWNYIHALDKFIEWIDHADAVSRLLNPPSIIKPNLHKGYLADLAALGIPTVPTELIKQCEQTPLDSITAARAWDHVVIKPAVGAGSYLTRAFTLDSDQNKLESERFLAQLLTKTDTIVQPFIDSVRSHGERAIVYIDGECTHAVRKEPRFDDQEEHVSDAIPVSQEEQTAAHRALKTVCTDPLYARIDLVRAADGAPLIAELELIEPSLFLLQHPPALNRLARAIARRAHETINSH